MFRRAPFHVASVFSEESLLIILKQIHLARDVFDDDADPALFAYQAAAARYEGCTAVGVGPALTSGPACLHAGGHLRKGVCSVARRCVCRCIVGGFEFCVY